MCVCWNRLVVVVVCLVGWLGFCVGYCYWEGSCWFVLVGWWLVVVCV